MHELLEIKVPFSGSVERVEINEWLVEVGDVIADGDVLADVSTDKVDTELESPHAGRLVQFLVEAGTEVEVGSVVALLAPVDISDDELAAALTAYAALTGSK